MSKVVNIFDYKNANSSKEGYDDSSGYFTVLHDLRLEFNTAFIQDLVIRLDSNYDKVLNILNEDFNKQYKVIEDLSGTGNEEDLKIFSKILDEVKDVHENVLNSMGTKEDFEAIFDKEDSIYLDCVSYLTTLILVTLYTDFEVAKMVKDNWIMLSVPTNEYSTLEIVNHFKSYI